MDKLYKIILNYNLFSRVLVERARGIPRDGGGGRSGGRDGGRSSRDGGSRRPGGSGRGDSRYGPPTRTEYRLIVENLSSRVSWQVSFPLREILCFGSGFMVDIAHLH